MISNTWTAKNVEPCISMIYDKHFRSIFFSLKMCVNSLHNPSLEHTNSFLRHQFLAKRFLLLQKLFGKIASQFTCIQTNKCGGRSNFDSRFINTS